MRMVRVSDENNCMGRDRRNDEERRTRLLKMLHNWQNTGKQKRIISDLRLKLDSNRLKRPKNTVTNIHKQQSEVWGTQYHKIFNMAIEKRSKLGIQANTIWIGMAEEALRLHREMMSKNTLNSWPIQI
jgi:hypothetical protein